MSKKSFLAVIAVAAILSAAVAGQLFAKAPAPSGNMNLRLNGFEIVGTSQVSIHGIGQVLADTAGSFNGDETFTYVDSASTSTGVCGGSITGGSIAFQGGSFGTQGQGAFTITMTFTPQTPVSGTACVATTITMLCNRTLLHKTLADDLNAGEYHCVVTDAAGTGISAVSMEGHLDIVAGSNAPQS